MSAPRERMVALDSALEVAYLLVLQLSQPTNQGHPQGWIISPPTCSRPESIAVPALPRRSDSFRRVATPFLAAHSR